MAPTFARIAVLSSSAGAKSSDAQYTRIDGRVSGSARKTIITCGPENGTAHVELGETHALGGVYIEAIKPNDDRPDEGLYSIHVEMTTGTSERTARDPGLLRDLNLDLTRRVERIIRNTRAISPDDLVVISGKLVWALRVEVLIMNDAGNALDAAVIAAIAALKHARRPDVSICGTDITVHDFAEREALPLPLSHTPVAVTFAIFSPNPERDGIFGAAGLYGGHKASPFVSQPLDMERFVLDPCLEEETCCDGSVTITINSHGEVCGVHKQGGSSIAGMQIMECATIATARARTICASMDEAMLKATNSESQKAKSAAWNASWPAIRPNDRVMIFSSTKPYYAYEGASLECRQAPVTDLERENKRRRIADAELDCRDLTKPQPADAKHQMELQMGMEGEVCKLSGKTREISKIAASAKSDQEDMVQRSDAGMSLRPVETLRDGGEQYTATAARKQIVTDNGSYTLSGGTEDSHDTDDSSGSSDLMKAVVQKKAKPRPVQGRKTK